MGKLYADDRVTLADIERLTGVPRRTLTRWQHTRSKLMKSLEYAVKADRHIKKLGTL